MVCLESLHLVYLILGIMGLMIYYPLCCIIYPSFQFQNKSLDIKYEPYFMVIIVQFNFFISRKILLFSHGDLTLSNRVSNLLLQQ